MTKDFIKHYFLKYEIVLPVIKSIIEEIVTNWHTQVKFCESIINFITSKTIYRYLNGEKFYDYF